MDIKRNNGFGLAKQALWIWIAATLLASLVLWGWLFSSIAVSVDAWQLWARYTARLSFFLFLASYIAAPLYELTKHGLIASLRRNRRNAGISFAIAHIIHLYALIAYLYISGEPTDMVTIIVGGGAYVVMFAMLASSNDAAIRRLGAVNWRRLHKFGAHYLAFVFVFMYTSGYLAGYGKPLILILLGWVAILLRIFVMIKTRGGTEK